MFFVKFSVLCLVFCMTESHILRRPFSAYHAHHIKAKCWGKNNARLMNSINQASCKPRETMVDLKSDLPNIMIFPRKVVMQQCGGGTCSALYSCLPVKSENVSIVVRKHDFHSQEESCDVITIQKHTKCICGCSLREQNCSQKQIFLDKECKCVCRNNEEEESCIKQGKRWDPATCNCRCMEENLECTTGTYWVPGLCRCVKLQIDDSPIKH